MPSTQSYDVIILGGGLAGLTLAIQLRRARPNISILVADKATHPLPEAAHKVGEAMGEAAAHYYEARACMREHLDTQHVHKLGLRFFFPAGDNRDITQRVELGPRNYLPTPSYMVDRGRFENALGVEARRQGAEFWDGCKVEQVDLGSDGAEHTVALQRGGQTLSVHARWLVDASGRAALLKRKLGLAKPVDHAINAAWFRIAAPINVDDWSDDAAWQARVPGRIRWLSTTHLMGEGYWIWLIPLASGSHSIGICADPRFHPFEQINTFERAMGWLHTHEPQLAQAIEAKRELRQDFRVLKHFAYGCEQVYSTDRWCLTGEAAVFPDPLFSPGSELIAVGNSFITDMITRELNGEDIVERLETFNAILLYSFGGLLNVYLGQYPLFGNAQVFTAKVIFDVMNYWGFLAPLSFRSKFTDLEYLEKVLPYISRAIDISARMESLFREWHELDHRAWQGGFVDQGHGLPFLSAMQGDLMVERDDDALLERIAANLSLMETLAAEIFRKAARLVGGVPEDRPVNPYAITLQPELWESDGLFSEQDGVPHNRELAAQLEHAWLDRVTTV